jgi:hypothetical protein
VDYLLSSTLTTRSRRAFANKLQVAHNIIIIIIIVTLFNDLSMGQEWNQLRSFIGLLYRPWMIDADNCGAICGMSEWQGKLKYSEETCPNAAVHHRFHMT